TVRPIAATSTMLLTTNPPMAYWRMMMPKTNARPATTATAITATTPAWMSCRRNRGVGRNAVHRGRRRFGLDGCDPETWAMVRSDMRGRSGTPLTFCSMRGKSYGRRRLSCRAPRTGRASRALRGKARRHFGSGHCERAWRGRGPDGYPARSRRPAMVSRWAGLPCDYAFFPSHGWRCEPAGTNHWHDICTMDRVEL